ncbi:MAG: thermonuclease family protein [Theionarchaea archaeon]|nr:thermonuclease family protein [Theionarchaea archaeon]
MQRKLNLGGLFLLFLLLFAIISCIHPGTTSNEDTTSKEYTIFFTEDTIFCTSIIDGDTFRLSNGETVRLIGIDAPELSQPGGEESREYLTQLILNKGITLEKGYEDRDKYNRLLRFVYIDDVCINEEMIRQGYAEARYLTDSISEYYIQLEIEAEIARAGLWSENIFQPRSKTVYIIGIIREYKGSPEIIVKTPGQIRILN